MKTHLGRSVCQGAQEYFSGLSGKYYFCQFAGRVAMGFTPSEPFLRISKFADIFMDVSDGLDLGPRIIGSLPDLLGFPVHEDGQKQISVTPLESALDQIRTISVIAVEVLSATALAGALHIVDLGRLAAQMGSVSLNGYHPIMPFVAIPLVPALQSCFIVLLASDVAIKILENRTLSSEIGKGSKLDINEITQKKLKRQENCCDVVNEVAIIAFQASLLFTLLNPPVLLSLGIISAGTTIIAGVIKTDSMKKWFLERLV